ncbi:MAG: glycosyl hydrolase [Actinomycetota bacterium]
MSEANADAAASHRTGPNGDSDEPTDPLERAIGGMALRNIGPAVLGGRIADVAVHPTDRATWYLAVGSGGVWKTTNAGITWQPLFDNETSYSIGCIAVDPSRPETVWVGTGEAVSGRHVAWGDGVYRSLDGGASWQAMGLDRSEHIADILIDPRDGDTVYVAAEGPLWSSGGERGLFRTTDGGATWEPALVIDDDTGVTSAVFAPDDPDTIYAASYQRRRSVRSFVGGGPGSGIHVSTDRGHTWERVTEGLPSGDLGKIGLAVTPAAPEIVYATVEATEADERGFHRSTNRGRTWERRNGYLSGGTGPHYYQEIFASPVDADTVYQVDVFVHVTNDGGKTFRNLEEHGAAKHSDNHVVWIDPDQPRHLLVGTDAGLYETFDEGINWRHSSNLPIAQFYRVAVDHSLPFTTVLGGAQDLGTVRGPLRTGHLDGVRNQDWSVPLGADGYHVAFDPHDHDIAYLEWQDGNVMRLHRPSGEVTDIRPIPEAGDPPERWNWDTPIVLSPHRPGRLYVASQRVWRSDDRGDSWTAISPDLTTDAKRLELPTGGRVWSVDALYDHLAMSTYATITDVSESPVVEGLLYVGTDDGRLHVSEDGGGTWRAAGAPPGLPAEAFINDVKACRHRPDAVFVVADDHKSGDYAPYLYESTDRGRTWSSIRGDLPDNTIGWSIEQDHHEPGLLFLGAERGVHVSLDGGGSWHRMGGKGMPTIAIRDLAVQRRDDDLVAGSFGRGFFVLDDYGPLRALVGAGADGAGTLDAPATMFPIRSAWRYVPFQPMQAKGQPTLGSTAWRAPNPEFGATFTYHLSEAFADAVAPAAKRRRKGEEDADTDGAGVAFPGWDALWSEHLEDAPRLALVVRDAEGRAVRSVPAATSAGLHRTSWDLRLPAPDPVRLTEPGFQPPWASDPRGPLAPAGGYTVELVRVEPAAG